MLNWIKRFLRKRPPEEIHHAKDCMDGHLVDVDKLIRCIKNIGEFQWQSNLNVTSAVITKYDTAADLFNALNIAIKATYAGDVVAMKSFGSFRNKEVTAHYYFTDHNGHDLNPNRFLVLLAKDLNTLSGNCDRSPGLSRESAVRFLSPLLEDCVVITALVESLYHASKK